MHQFELNISKNIDRYSLLNHEQLIIVALSGGADSVALLCVLKSLGYNCLAAHCNFHLRGEESNRDEQHAVAIAQQLGLECEVVHFDVDSYEKEHGVSTEMACRELRYEWFEQLRQQYEAQAIAVAHHRDDDIETMFLNLLRGSGIVGAAAMRWKNGYIVRPMLNVSRNEIEQYLLDQHINYVVDSTNLESEFKRNKLRNDVLPTLQRAFPGADEMLAKSLVFLKENRAIYQHAIAQASQQYQRDDTIALAKIISEYIAPTTLLSEILHPKGFNISQIEDMIDSANESGRKFYSQQHVAIINRGEIILSSIDDFNSNDDEYEIRLNESISNPINIEISFINPSNFSPSKSPNKIYLDEKVLEGKPRFVLRHWREGDKMAPFGMNGTKKLSDIFSDAKLSLTQKNNLWILERNGEILWIVGMRASRHFAVTPHSNSILILKCAHI